MHTKRWIEWLQQRGHQVDTRRLVFDPQSATMALAGPEPVGLDSSKSTFSLVGLVTPLYRTLRDHGLIPLGVATMLNAMLALLPLKRLIDSYKPDVIHNHFLSLDGVAVAFLNAQPLVISAWGSDIFRAADDRISVSIRSWVLRRAKYVTTTSHFMRKTLIEDYGLPRNRVIRIPWGIDRGVFQQADQTHVRATKLALGFGHNSSVLLSPRAVRPLYRIKVILEAFADALPEIGDAYLVLVCGVLPDAGYQSDIKQMTTDLGVASRVKILEKLLTPEQMAQLYSIADAAVSVPMSDQFGSSLLEAMACGAVPIVAQLPVYREYLRDGCNALFVQGDDSKELARAIARALTDEELKLRCRRVNQDIVREHEDWKKNAPAMEGLYLRLVRERGRSRFRGFRFTSTPADIHAMRHDIEPRAEWLLGKTPPDG
ncbi:MAG: glycosyltransferase family 4 protein [Dehalococcoidia bacterium]|nr:glycosyltransferase family 4 protein [Dehalococcoidia bacterium]